MNRGRKDYMRKRKNSSSNQTEDEQIKKLEKLLADQKMRHEEELKRKDEEMKMRRREIEGGATAAPPTVVVDIDQGNIELVSLEHNGMIMNPDGSLTRTKQYETYMKNKEIQLKDTYETTPIMPEELNSVPNHPQPTNQKQKWSYKGDWHEIPVNPDQEGTELEECRVVRIEPYIDIDGVIKKV